MKCPQLQGRWGRPRGCGPLRNQQLLALGERLAELGPTNHQKMEGDDVFKFELFSLLGCVLGSINDSYLLPY